MLWKKWRDEIAPQLKKKLAVKNEMALPKVEKVVINMGIAGEKDDSQAIEQFVEQMSLIAGQKPKICRAKKSVSGFKLREGEIIGLKATLRGKRMYSFLEKLFNLVLPRLRDFRGLPEGKFDSSANYSFGIPEQTVFPEVKIEKIKRIKGVGVTIVTSTKDRHQARELLALLGLHFTH